MFEKLGAAEMARQVGQGPREIFSRRESLENKLKRQIVAPLKDGRATRTGIEHPGRLHSDVENGVVLVGSDCHYWPGPPSLMHRALVQFCRELKPVEVVLNGDVIDACTISKYPPIGWTKLPTVQEEIEAAQERLGEIEKAASRARKRWPLGNHDSRFETRLASMAPEFRRVTGTRLADHFSLWEPCWSVWLNEDVVVKHRFKGGMHATRNNTLNSGKTTITGHLHSQKVTPFTDYNGTRWGVDTGCVADPDHRAFVDYTEDNSKDWRDGFCVLSFRNGRLLPPELVSRWDDDHVVWRGEVIKV
jgi:hypothetical protein